MDEMTKEELLSAYLDGEVTAEQRAYVEKLIATDNEARVALEELRAMSAALKGLPRMTVGEDLSERVLRRAERAILEQKPAQESPAAAGKAAENKSSVETVVNQADDTLVQPRGAAGASSGVSWKRRLAGPLAAIAAAVLIMVVNNQQEKAELAQAPNFAPTMAESEESVPRDESARDQAFQAAPDEATHRELGERGAPSMSAMRAPAKEAAGDFAADRATTPAADADLLDGMTDKLAKAELPRGKGGYTARGSQAPLQSGNEGQEETSAESIASPSIAMKRNRATANAEKAPHGTFGLVEKQGELGIADETNQLASQPQLVVDIVVSSAALKSNAFDQLLARQNIHFDAPASLNDFDRLADAASMRKNQQADEVEVELEGSPAQPGAAATAQAKPTDSSDDVASKTAKAGDQELRVPNEEALVLGAEQGDKRREKKPAGENDASVELVYVVASAAQVQAALEEMQQQSQNYLAYSIEPQQMRSGDGSESAHAEEGTFRTDSRPAENSSGRQQRSAVKTSEAAKGLLEKGESKNQPRAGKKRDLNTRTEESKDAEPAVRSKPETLVRTAPPSAETQFGVTNATEGERRGADQRESQSDSKLGWAREQRQAAAGRAQRVQITVEELSRWRENSYEELPNRVAAAQAKQYGQRHDQQALSKANSYKDGESNGTRQLEPSPAKPKSLAKSEPEKSAAPKAPELAQERESKKDTPAEEPAPAGNAVPSPSPSVAPPGELKAAGSRTQKPMVQPPAPPVQLELQQKLGIAPASGQQQDLVRVLFVVRGTHFDQSKQAASQSGAGAAEADAETKPQAQREPVPAKSPSPENASPAPNAAPPGE